jgi:hypothetical protein
LCINEQNSKSEINVAKNYLNKGNAHLVIEDYKNYNQHRNIFEFIQIATSSTHFAS